jgi:hypothetical protein
MDMTWTTYKTFLAIPSIISCAYFGLCLEMGVHVMFDLVSNCSNIHGLYGLETLLKKLSCKINFGTYRPVLHKIEIEL